MVWGGNAQHGSALLWVGELVYMCLYIRFSWQHDDSLDSCQCKTPLGNSMKFQPRSDKAHGGWLGVWVEVTLLVHAISSFENGSSHIVWKPHASCLLICGCMRTIRGKIASSWCDWNYWFMLIRLIQILHYGQQSMDDNGTVCWQKDAKSIMTPTKWMCVLRVYKPKAVKKTNGDTGATGKSRPLSGFELGQRWLKSLSI